MLSRKLFCNLLNRYKKIYYNYFILFFCKCLLFQEANFEELLKTKQLSIIKNLLYINSFVYKKGDKKNF